jgi:hypothetical protein
MRNLRHPLLGRMVLSWSKEGTGSGRGNAGEGVRERCGARPERRRLRREDQCDERSTKSRCPSRRSLLLSGLPTSRVSGVPKLKQGGVTARVACAARGDPRLVLDGHVLGSIVHARGDGFIAECRWHGSGAGGGEASSPMRRVRVLSGENRIGGRIGGIRRGLRGRDARRFGRRKRRWMRGLWRRGCTTPDTPIGPSRGRRRGARHPRIRPLRLSRKRPCAKTGRVRACRRGGRPVQHFASFGHVGKRGRKTA